MVKTQSRPIQLGTKAYNFSLPNCANNEIIELYKSKGQAATVVIFMCNHCPFVLHLLNKFVGIIQSYESKNVACIAINSNDISQYPDDSPENMTKLLKQYNIKFPYVFDELQEIAKQYQAQCTPDIYIYNKNLELTYHGKFDDSSPGNNIEITGESLINAIELTILNKSPDSQEPSVGCSIKWK